MKTIAVTALITAAICFGITGVGRSGATSPRTLTMHLDDQLYEPLIPKPFGLDCDIDTGATASRAVGFTCTNGGSVMEWYGNRVEFYSLDRDISPTSFFETIGASRVHVWRFRVP